jgi:hypothetical protein
MPTEEFEFGPSSLDSQRGMLFREGDHVALPPKVAELLVALVRAEGGVLTREELLHHLWSDTVVEEGSLTSHISPFRKAVGEAPLPVSFHVLGLARHHRHPPPTCGYQNRDISGVAGKYVIAVLSDEHERSINGIHSASLRQQRPCRARCRLIDREYVHRLQKSREVCLPSPAPNLRNNNGAGA